MKEKIIEKLSEEFGLSEKGEEILKKALANFINKEELVEKIGKMKMGYHRAKFFEHNDLTLVIPEAIGARSYNEALDDIINLIKEE
jgi:hypothetical protein